MQITAGTPSQGLLATLTEQRLLTVLDDSAVPLSRAEIAQVSGLSKPAVSDAARRLEESGIIVATGTREGRRGGVATLYDLNADRGHSVAIAVDSTTVSARALRLDGSLGAEASLALVRNPSQRDVIQAAREVLESIERDCTSPLLTAAVSVADPIDPATGAVIEVIDSVFPAGHLDLPEALGIPTPVVSVDNDVNWAALAEHHLGSMRSVDDFIYFYVGAGLGAGLFLGGRIHRGARGLAGEIGHLRQGGDDDLTRTLARLGWGDPAGGYGLDVALATTALLTEPAMQSTRDALDLLTGAAADIVTLLNSRAVVLGGPIATLPAFVDYIAHALPSRTLDQVEVVVGECTPLDGAGFEAQRLAKSGLGF